MTVTVSAIELLEVATGNSVPAELRDSIEAANIADWQTTWQPALERLLIELVKRGRSISEWPQSWHWDWSKKVARIKGLLGHKGFCVVGGGMTQGLMTVNLIKNAVLPEQKGKPLVCVDYLEAAPWNRPELNQQPRLRGVGSALITAAAILSIEEGFAGRVGLHSLPQSENFYRDKCHFTDLGNDPKYDDLRYFEFTPEQAQAFLK